MPRRTKPQLAAPATYERLLAMYPDAHCDLDHGSTFQLLVATVLSAQTTDKLVNRVTPALFAAYPDAAALAGADVAAVEQVINRIGMFRQKSKNVVGLARALLDRHEGNVPRSLDELVALPGVGRKTANVVLGVAFRSAVGVVVDTHVQRITQRLGWTREVTPDRIELDLMSLFPQSEWDRLSHTIIYHGRRICFARAPACAACGVADVCPSAGRAERVGRKPSKRRLALATPAAVVDKR